MGVERSSYVKTSCFQESCIAADHVSESDLLSGGLGIDLCFINVLCYVIVSHHLKRQETTK